MAKDQITFKDYHIIKDPVHGSMRFTPAESKWISLFIDSENFQRLRHIKQAGLADWVFIGAVHTRFNHCIGCCYVAGQICNQLKLDPEQKQVVILASLLHDIGHGPFSHVFEAIFHRWYIRHELWTPMFVQEYAESPFLEAFNRVNKKYPLNTQKMQSIQELIMHQYRDNRLLSDIVSSQLDADRLDYLLRDSHFCGVNYGHFDLSWLLHCLTVIEKDGQKRLGIIYKGVGAVEQYLMARRLMIRNIYQHSKKYAAEFILQQFLKQVAKGIADNSHFETVLSTPLGQFLRSTNAFNVAAKQTDDLQSLSELFLRENYNLYKQLCDYDVFDLIRRMAHWDFQHPAVTIANRLQTRKLPRVLRVHEDNADKVKELIENFKQTHPEIQSWQIALLVLPHLAYKVDEDSILMKDASNNTHYLQDISMMISAISDKRESAYLVSIDIEIERQLEKEGLLKLLCGL
jgi:HD superfamily phosphohydrolase